MPLLTRFLRDTTGATSIEYAMIGVFLSVMIIVGARAIGVNIQAKFLSVSNGLS